MAEQLYRVVKSQWIGGKQVFTPIASCGWKPEKAAKEEMKKLSLGNPYLYSIQKQTKEHK